MGAAEYVGVLRSTWEQRNTWEQRARCSRRRVSQPHEPLREYVTCAKRGCDLCESGQPLCDPFVVYSVQSTVRSAGHDRSAPTCLNRLGATGRRTEAGWLGRAPGERFGFAFGHPGFVRGSGSATPRTGGFFAPWPSHRARRRAGRARARRGPRPSCGGEVREPSPVRRGHRSGPV